MIAHPNRNKPLIRATNTTPAVTLNWLRETANSTVGLTHARDVVDQCSTQVGRNACAAAYAELDRLEAALYAADQE